MMDFIRELKIKYYAFRMKKIGSKSPKFADYYRKFSTEVRSRSAQQIIRMEEKRGLK